MNNYHPTVQKIKQLLDSSGVGYTCFEHIAVRTSEEAATTRPEYSISQGAKALIIRLKNKDGARSFAQIVVPGDQRFDVKKVRNELGIKNIRFATLEEVGDVTEGIIPGGVPPFGTLFSIPVYVEETLLKNKEIIFNAGDQRYSIAMKSDDYIQVVTPHIVSVI